MRRLFCVELFLGLLLIEDVRAAGIVYVTDLPVYSALAPCAQWAVSYEVQQLTQSECVPGVTALESCACTQDQNSAAVSSSIASQVLFTCGKTASDDVSSASVVFSAYCNQGAAVTTAPPGPNAVTQYITDLSAYSDLAPCASGGLSYLVMGLTHSICNTLGPSALASCVCSKNQNSLAISGSLVSQIKFTCGSTHTEDITSAQAVLAGYCGMANGTTSFPTPSYLPGTVSYYITALPQYQSLASCAKEALSYPVQAQTMSDCPSNPQALVSCLCVKDSNSIAMTSRISGSASLFCGSTASANMASALSVFDFYCSVGKGLATVAGQLSSVATSAYGTKTGSQATGTGKYSTPGATSTGTSGDGGSGTLSSPLLGTTKNGVPISAIAGAAAGAIIFICFIIFAFLRYRRRRLRNRPPPPQMILGPGPRPDRPDWGKAALPNTQTSAISPQGSMLKPVSSPMSPVSPIDSRPSPFPSPGPRPAEMAVPPPPFRAEVASEPNRHELPHTNTPPPPFRAEAPAGSNRQELPNTQTPPPPFQTEAPSRPTRHQIPHAVPQNEAPVQGSSQRPAEMGASLNGPFEMDGDGHWRP